MNKQISNLLSNNWNYNMIQELFRWYKIHRMKFIRLLINFDFNDGLYAKLYEYLYHLFSNAASRSKTFSENLTKNTALSFLRGKSGTIGLPLFISPSSVETL